MRGEGTRQLGGRGRAGPGQSRSGGPGMADGRRDTRLYAGFTVRMSMRDDRARTMRRMEGRVSVSDLLLAWREATRAAELAARLAEESAEAAGQADGEVAATEELATLAEAAAEAAERAAVNARACAARARGRADVYRGTRIPDAERAARDARGREDDARERYQQAAKRADADGDLTRAEAGRRT